MDFRRGKEYWDNSADKEEECLSVKSVNRDLRWREIERHLVGISSILDVGGGTGAFSIPLARRGFSVTHLDLSPAMLEIARIKSKGIGTIRFIEGNVIEMSTFSDKSFDLVLNMDGPVSYCGCDAERAISESARVARKTLILAVAHRAWGIPLWMRASLASAKFLPAVYEMLERGNWCLDQFAENAALTVEFPFRALRAFLPDEMRRILEQLGMRVLRIGGLGSLDVLCGATMIEHMLENESLYHEYLELCERFDHEILVQGPGTQNDTGLIAVAEWADLSE